MHSVKWRSNEHLRVCVAESCRLMHHHVFSIRLVQAPVWGSVKKPHIINFTVRVPVIFGVGSSLGLGLGLGSGLGLGLGSGLGFGLGLGLGPWLGAGLGFITLPRAVACTEIWKSFHISCQ